MPLLSHHRTSASAAPSSAAPSYTSKPDKPHRPAPAPPYSRRILLPVVAFSVVSLAIGVAGVSFSLYALRRPGPSPVFRCGRSVDTFRALYSASGSRKLGDGGNGGLATTADRPKLLGLVGIQTGFDSADRRAAIRSTWLASDPDGLLRYLLLRSCKVFIFR